MPDHGSESGNWPTKSPPALLMDWIRAFKIGGFDFDIDNKLRSKNRP